MLDQFFRFLFTMALSGLFYVLLAIVGIEGWRQTSGEELADWARFLANGLALFCGGSLAFWLQRRWVFGRGGGMKVWGRYLAFMVGVLVLHELLLTVMLAVLPLSYPIILLVTLTVGAVLAFLGCKKYVF